MINLNMSVSGGEELKFTRISIHGPRNHSLNCPYQKRIKTYSSPVERIMDLETNTLTRQE